LVEQATAGAIKNWKLGEKSRNERLEKGLEKTKQIAKKMGEVTLSYTRKASLEDGIFGSVGKTDIVKSLKTCGYEISKNNVELKEPIRKIGESKVLVDFGHGINCEVTVKIVPKK
jgi:large subunit ribosomal protein L9